MYVPTNYSETHKLNTFVLIEVKGLVERLVEGLVEGLVKGLVEGHLAFLIDSQNYS